MNEQSEQHNGQDEHHRVRNSPYGQTPLITIAKRDPVHNV